VREFHMQICTFWWFLAFVFCRVERKDTLDQCCLLGGGATPLFRFYDSIVGAEGPNFERMGVQSSLWSYTAPVNYLLELFATPIYTTYAVVYMEK